MGTHPIFESDFDCLTVLEMSGLLDSCQQIDCSGCSNIFGQYRNIVVSITSGIFFFTGWWIIIDAAVRCNIAEYPDLKMFDYYHVCGVVGTIAFLVRRGDWLACDFVRHLRGAPSDGRKGRLLSKLCLPWSLHLSTEHFHFHRDNAFQVWPHRRVLNSFSISPNAHVIQRDL